MEGGMNVAFSAIRNALFWQIPTKQTSLTRAPSYIQPSPVPSAAKKRTYEQYLSCVPMDRVRLLGDKVMMLLRHESS